MLLRPALCLVVLAATATASAQPAPDAALQKIAPWVLNATEGGRTAEYLVVLKDQADLSAARLLTTKEAKGRFVYDTLFAKARETQAPILADLEARGAPHRSYYIVNFVWVKGDRPLALALAARDDVARIDPNPEVRNVLPAAEAMSDERPIHPLAPLAPEAGVSYVRAPQVWALGITGQGVVVGGQDTGIRWTHNALKPHYRGWNGTTASHDYNWHDSIHATGSSCGADSPTPCDDWGHGSHTIGTAVGSDGGANQVGVAPGAKFIGCRNMNAGAGTPTTYLECFQFFLAPYPVAGTPAQGDPTKAPDVTTNSWGCPTLEGCNTGNFETMRLAIAAQRAAGIFTEASAGNSGASGCSTVTDPPAIFDESFTVGALEHLSDTISNFSSRGPVTVDGSGRIKPDIAAPGRTVFSAYNTSDSAYTYLDGTSMAGPHVGGGAALVIAAFPALKGNVNAIEQRLANSAFRISSASCGSTAGVYPNNVFGNGRMDLGCAVPGFVSGDATICQGTSTNLSVSLTGTGPWTLTWSDGFIQSVPSANPATRSVSPATTTVYTVTNVANGSCNQSAAGSATVTVTPDTTAPVVTAPAAIAVDQTLCCGAFGGASGATSPALLTFLGAGSATEECSTATRLAPQVGGVDADGTTCFGTGTTPVTFRYQDGAGNTGTATANVTVRMFGDLDQSNVIDAADLVVLRSYVNLSIPQGPPPFSAPLNMADVNHDTTIDSSDLVILRAYLNLALSCLSP